MRAVELYNKLRDTYPAGPIRCRRGLALAMPNTSMGIMCWLRKHTKFTVAAPAALIRPYVIYQTGMSLMKQFRSIDRATTILQEAHEYFARLQQVYPDSPYAKDAGEKMHTCRRLMAEHELYVMTCSGIWKSAGSLPGGAMNM